MRFFKHGDSLAIVLPEKLRKSSGAKEGDEYEFLELDNAAFALVSREKIEKEAKQSVLALMLKKISEKDNIANSGTFVSGEQFASSVVPKAAAASNLVSSLLPKGYAIIETEEEAKKFSSGLEQQIRSKEILGVRAFDKKFYVATSEYYSSVSPKIFSVITDKDSGLSEISSSSKLDEKACLAILNIMKDVGGIIEKKKGLYRRV